MPGSSTRCEALDNQFRPAGQSRDRVPIARIGNQCGPDELVERRPRGAPRDPRTEIRGQAPARVEGRAKAGDSLAAHQRLEPHERGHGPDSIRRVDQIGGGGIHRYLVRKSRGDRRLDRSGAQARFDIGMGLVDDPRIRVRFPRALQQCHVRADIGAAAQDRRIVLDLTRDHDHRLRARPLDRRPPSDIVFGQASRDDPTAQPGGAPGIAAAGGGFGDQPLQIAGRVRVEVYALPVKDQRSRLDQRRPQADRPQEAVFDEPGPDRRPVATEGRRQRHLRGPEPGIAVLGPGDVYRLLPRVAEAWRARQGGAKPHQTAPLPEPDIRKDLSDRVAGRRLGGALVLERLDHRPDVAEPVAPWIVVDRIAQVTAGEELGHRQGPCSARMSALVLGQSPSGVEAVTETAHAASRQHRLVAKLRTDRIDDRGPGDHVPGVHVVGQNLLGTRQITWRKVPLLGAGHDVGVGFYDQPGAGILDARGVEHPAEGLLPGTAPLDRGITPGLVDDDDMPAAEVAPRHGRGVLREPRLAQPDERRLGLGCPGCVEIDLREDPLQPRRTAGIVVDTKIVDDQRERRRPGHARPERAQEAILDGDQPRPGAPGDGPPARGHWTLAPHGHRIIRSRPAQTQIPSDKRQDAPDPALAQEAERVGIESSAARPAHVRRQKPPSERAAPPKLMIGEIPCRIFCQRT